MTKEKETRLYRVNGFLYRIETECRFKDMVYKYQVSLCLSLEKNRWEILESFRTLKEAENYLKEIEKGELR